MWQKNVVLIFSALIILTGCETRSKLVANSVYSQPPTLISLECENSIKTVEIRQLVKNSSLVLMPVAAILSGGASVVAVAAVNGGITLDDELNANQIAENCKMQQHQKNNEEILLTMATSSTVSAITGSINIVNMPIQPAVE